MIRSLISTDFIKLTTSVLLIGSTNFVKIDTLDFFVIAIDLLNLSYFQILVHRAYFSFRGVFRKEIKCPLQQSIASHLTPYQLYLGRSIPINLTTSMIEIFRILGIFLFFRSKLSFGVFSIIFNLLVMIYIVGSFINRRKKYVTAIYICYSAMIFLESLLFLLIGI